MKSLCMRGRRKYCVPEECFLFRSEWQGELFSPLMSAVLTWETLTFIINFKVWVKKGSNSDLFAMKESLWTLLPFPLNTPPDHSLSPLGLRWSLSRADRQALTIASLKLPPISARPKLAEEHAHPWLHPPPSSLSPFCSATGSHHGRVAGLVWGNLQPDATICYVANALCSSSFTFSNTLLCIVNALLAFMKVFTCIHKPRCWYL